LVEFVVGSSETDLESFDFAEPAFPLGFVDTRGQVVADLGDAVPLSGIRPVHAAPQAPLTELTAEFGQLVVLPWRGVASLRA
jgi:hypothetical protein